MAEANWYVVHTYSGYENKVKVDIEKTIENRKLQDEILEVRVPLEDVVEMRNGVKKQVSRKMFPGSGDEERNLKTGSEKDVSRLCASQYGDE